MPCPHQPVPNPAACRLKPRPGAPPPCYSRPRLLPPAPAGPPGPRAAAPVPPLATDPDLQAGSPPADSAGEKRMPQDLPQDLPLSRGPAGLCGAAGRAVRGRGAVPRRGGVAAHLVFGVWLCFVSVRGLHLHLAVHRADGGGLGTQQGQHQPRHSSPASRPAPPDPTSGHRHKTPQDQGLIPAPAPTPRLVRGCSQPWRVPRAESEVPTRLPGWAPGASDFCHSFNSPA